MSLMGTKLTHQGSNGFIISADLLDEIISAIEAYEETKDCEIGAGRSYEELVKDNCMPELYGNLVALRNKSVMDQAEGRMHRTGQKNAVHLFNLCENSNDLDPE